MSFMLNRPKHSVHGAYGGTAVAPNPPTQIALNAGDSQSATVNVAVAVAPSAIVKDVSNNPVSGVTVTFAVVSGGGSVSGGTAVTGSDGIATVGSWTMGSSAGSNTMTATASGLSGSPVTFTATAIAAGSNRPAGMTQILSRGFAALNEGGCTDTSNNGTAAATGGVGILTLPTGFTDSSNPPEFKLGGTTPFTDYIRLYTKFELKISSNWYGHSATGDQKVCIIHRENGVGDGVLMLDFNAFGSGNAALSAIMGIFNLGANYPSYPSGTPSSSPVLEANLAAATLTRNTSQVIELSIYAGTTNVADGTLEMWIDGVKTHNFTGIKFLGSGVTMIGHSLTISPVYGGTGGAAVPADQSYTIDNWEIWGKAS